jgi:hypothetical protein
LFVYFISLEKEFDKFEMKITLESLERNDVPNGLVILIKNIYTNNFIRVKYDNKVFGKIPVQKGVRKGDSLSSLLFNLVMNEITKEVNHKRDTG